MSNPRSLDESVDAVIDSALEAGTIVGTVVLVTEDGSPRYARAAGFADREAGKPTELDTIFRLASLTKSLVSVTALRLIEQGRLGLDDLVTTYLPDFRPRLEDGREAGITVRHLLTHTSGFGYAETPSDPRGEDNAAPVERYWAARVSTGLDQPGLSLEENLRRIASVPLYFTPGTSWRYGVSTDVLGAVLTTVLGGSLADAVAEFVTEPLGMVDTAFTVRDRDRLAVPYADGSPRAERMRDPHTVIDLTFSPARALDDRSFQSGGGGMVGTAGDFMTFLETIRTGGAPILGGEILATATTNHVGLLRGDDDPGWAFGLMSGVLVDPQEGSTPQSVGTLAWGGVWGHQWFIDREAGLSVAMLTNTAVEGCLGQFPRDVRDAIYAVRASTPSRQPVTRDPTQ